MMARRMALHTSADMSGYQRLINQPVLWHHAKSRDFRLCWKKKNMGYKAQRLRCNGQLLMNRRCEQLSTDSHSSSAPMMGGSTPKHPLYVRSKVGYAVQA
jgi:hypothetical protein